VVRMVEEALAVVAAEEVLSFMATMEIAASPKAKIARLAALVAVTVVALGPCRMWDVVRASTCKRPLTSMLVVVAISMPFAPEEISHASSQRAAC